MSKEETMVERVAKAIAATLHPEPRMLVGMVPIWRTYTPSARAAIEALMEPTDGMSEAGYGKFDCDDFDEAFNRAVVNKVYRAMLSKAKEGTGE